MAKGFTVKAKTPKAAESTQEWDYEKAKEMVKGKSIVFLYVSQKLCTTLF